jgi:pimeloyl-ACP methyl ester carboxylesterase
MKPDHRTLDTLGVRVHFSVVGDEGAPSALLIHGWASSSRMWSSTIEHLRDRYRCVALDLPGHGESDKPGAGWYSITHFADVVEAVGREAGVVAPLIFGHSMGGAISLHLAVHSSLAPQRLVLINPLVVGPVTPVGPQVRRWLYRPALAVGRRLWPVASELLERSTNGHHVRRAGGTGRLRQRSDLARTTADSAIGSMKAALTCDLSDELAQVSCPSLMILGQHDRTIPPERGREAARRIPNAVLAELDAGHHPFDRAREAYFEALDQFLGKEEAA